MQAAVNGMSGAWPISPYAMRAEAPQMPWIYPAVPASGACSTSGPFPGPYAPALGGKAVPPEVPYTVDARNNMGVPSHDFMAQFNAWREAQSIDHKAAQELQTHQWNAMLQYFAYYSYLYSAAAVAPPHPQPSSSLPPSKPVTPEQLNWMDLEKNKGFNVERHGPRPLPTDMPGPAAVKSPWVPDARAQLPPIELSPPMPPPLDIRKRERSDEADVQFVAHKGKKKRANHDLKTCVNCGVSRTPFWRKEKDGEGSLCNACGLYLAKNDAPRPKMLWKRNQ